MIRRSTNRPCGQRANHHTGYAQVNVGGKILLAHRAIYAILHGEMPGEVDHIDGNPMNNRIENLRDVSHLDNMHNYPIPETNTSGCPGVSWHTRDRKWQAHIRVNNKKIHLGYFEDFEDAVEARKMAKIKYHPTSPEAIKYARESSEE